MLTEKREECEHEASLDTTANLVNPEVVESHPLRLVLDARRLDVVPEGGMLQILVTNELQLVMCSQKSGCRSAVRRHRVRRNLALAGELDKAQRLLQDRFSRLAKIVLLVENNKNQRAERKHDGGQREGQPEADVSLSIDHGDLADDGTNVDEQVEICDLSAPLRPWEGRSCSTYT